MSVLKVPFVAINHRRTIGSHYSMHAFLFGLIEAFFAYFPTRVLDVSDI